MNEEFITISEFETKNDKNDYEVWDEKKQKWCNFKDSCYYSNSEFPKPEEAKFPINLISIHYSKEDEVYTFGLRPYTGDSPLVKNYHYCSDEKTMLERFIKHFRKKSVDILTGWNVMGFDVPYIVNRCRNLKIETLLSPINLDYVQRKTGGYHIEGGGFTIPGISILDGLELYKNFVYTKRERYSLQFIGKLEVNEGKKDLEGTVNTAWKQWNEFVEYNIQDVLLCKKIEDKKKHIKLTIQFCYQALIPFERIFSSITLVTGYMLRYLHERNIVFPDRINTEKNKKFPGAYVMAKPGFYEYVVSFDVASMYPHEIMTYNISPETICDKEYTLTYKDKDYFFDGNDEILVESSKGYIKKFVKDLQENDVIYINTSK